MNGKKNRFSLHHFYYFLEVIWEERLVKNTTLSQWQEAVKEFQQVLTREEWSDLRSVDIKDLSRRYVDMLVDQRSSITPWRIHKLKSQLNAAFGEFIAFTVNPDEYRRNKKFARAKEAFLQNYPAPRGRVVPLAGPAVQPATRVPMTY